MLSEGSRRCCHQTTTGASRGSGPALHLASGLALMLTPRGERRHSGQQIPEAVRISDARHQSLRTALRSDQPDLDRQFLTNIELRSAPNGGSSRVLPPGADHAPRSASVGLLTAHQPLWPRRCRWWLPNLSAAGYGGGPGLRRGPGRAGLPAARQMAIAARFRQRDHPLLQRYIAREICKALCRLQRLERPRTPEAKQDLPAPVLT